MKRDQQKDGQEGNIGSQQGGVGFSDVVVQPVAFS